MKAIYEPKGRAREYGELACNLALACDHGCKYCYVPAALRKDREEFHDNNNVQPRPGILDALEKDAAKYANTGKSIFLCFSCDPGHIAIAETTIRAIEILNAFGLAATVLTKSSHASALFPALMGNRENRFGMTLTCDVSVLSEEWEPKAALPETRKAILADAHKAGIKTWASMEPVIYPNQTLALINDTHTFIDHFKVGKMNHHPHANQFIWPKFREDAIALLERLGCDYYIKRDLRDAN